MLSFLQTNRVTDKWSDGLGRNSMSPIYRFRGIKTVEKRENTSNRDFTLFPQCLHPIKDRNHYFYQNYIFLCKYWSFSIELNVTTNTEFVLHRVENLMGKVGKACLLLCTYPVILSLYMCVFIFGFPCGYF